MISSIGNDFSSTIANPYSLIEEFKITNGTSSSNQELYNEAKARIEKISQKNDALVANLSMLQLQSASQQNILNNLPTYNSKGEVSSSALEEAQEGLPSFSEAAFMQSLGPSYVTMNDMTQSHKEVMAEAITRIEDTAQEAVENGQETRREELEEAQALARENNGVLENIEEMREVETGDETNRTDAAKPSSEETTPKVNTSTDDLKIEFETQEKPKEIKKESFGVEVQALPANAKPVDIFV